MLRYRRPLPTVAPASLGLHTVRGLGTSSSICRLDQTDTSGLPPRPRAFLSAASVAFSSVFPSHALQANAGPAAALVTPTRAYHTITRTLLRQDETPLFDALSLNEEDGPTQLIIPSSTTLTIGDIAVPIPDYSLHPERISWVMPGLDHTVDPLMQAVANTSSTAAAPVYSLSRSVDASLRSAQEGQMQQLSRLPQGNMFFSLQDPLTKSYLRWMAQKESLGQDMCLIGEPGPAMRWLVVLYSFLTRRETRIVYLNRDVTESDLKQRREIRNGTLVYEDQSAVAAAREGQLLVLEGLERVERNVLPVINNLLENREMHLDNGAVLIHPARYDSLLRDLVRDKMQQRLRRMTPGHAAADEKSPVPPSSVIRSSPTQATAEETARLFPHDNSADMQALVREAKQQLKQMGLLRVSENFRVVGITVPVPPYEGNPLDPPLRSRFQCLYVKTPPPTAAADFSVLASRRPGTDSGVDREGFAALAATHAARLDAVRQLRIAVDAVNAATSDFTTSSPTSSPAATAHSTATGSSSAAASAMTSQLSNIGNYELGILSKQLAAFPDAPVGELLVRSFPWTELARQLPHGGNASSSVGQEEVRRRYTQYSELLSRCNISPPFLLPPTLAPPPSTTSTATPRTATSASANQSSTARQIGGVLLDMLGTRPSTAVAAAAAFIHSAKLVGRAHTGHGDTSASGTHTTTAIPTAVAQCCNYITRIENVRRGLTLTTGSSADSGGADDSTPSHRHVFVADAVVATATQNEGKAGGGAGTYRLPIFMGSSAPLREALPLPDSSSPNFKDDASSGYTVAEVCPTENAVLTTELFHVLQTMLQLHAVRSHICLLGPTGCGKTAMVREFARLLGYERETMHLYADMTNKDLFQRRTTDSTTGNTTWDNAALVDAAIKGKLVVLDGIDKLPPGMLSSLQQLLVDQSASLFDGTVLKPPQEYAMLKQKLRRTDPRTGTVVYEPTDADMAARKIFPIHPAFRVVATARPPSSVSEASTGGSGGGRRSFTLSQDVTTLFSVVSMPEASEQTLAPVLSQVAREELATMVATGLLATGSSALAEREQVGIGAVQRLLKLRTELERLRVMDPKIPQLSFRQLLHLVRAAVRYPDNLTLSLTSALLLPLMTGVTAAQVSHVLAQNGFDVSKAREAERSMSPAAALRLASSEHPRTSTDPHHAKQPSLPSAVEGTGHEARRAGSGARTFAVKDEVVLRFEREYTANELALVPFVTGFYGNPVHEAIIAWLARQYAMGSNILLIGNQGVGKNKVVDAFLSRIQVPRHYIQLHRDTTVGSLTINPTVEGGKVRWEDSPLVKAVQLGHCLVVDEIDKASVEVVQVLKGLIEDREMRLGDGRQIVDPALMAGYRHRHRSPHHPGHTAGDHKVGTKVTEEVQNGSAHSNTIAMHPDFRIIVLANPPGYPFHGNDFFRECGDLFSAYVMGNPDQASQLQVLRAYAPSIPDPVLAALIRAFQQLQEAFEQGNLTYPFSLRELIAVVKHLARFPQDGIYEALNNVFHFDARDPNTLRTVRQVLHQHLSPIGSKESMRTLLPLHAGLPTPLKPNSTPLVVPFPKHGHDTAISKAAGNKGSVPGKDDFAVSLPTLVCQDPVALRQRLQRQYDGEDRVAEQLSETGASASALRCGAAVCWKEHYGEAAYAAEAVPHHPQRRASDSFTEWAATLQMPFIHAETDTVLHVLPVTSTASATGVEEAGASMGTSTLLSFLISRKEPVAADPLLKSPRRLLLATVHLPPTLLELSETSATIGVGRGQNGLTSLGWPVGEVHFLDLTSLLPASAAALNASGGTAAPTEAAAAAAANEPADDAAALRLHRAVVASDFNLAAHSELFSRRPIVLGGGGTEVGSSANTLSVVEPLTWPLSATLRVRQHHLRGLVQSILNTHEGIRWPTVLLQLPACGSVGSDGTTACGGTAVLVDVLAGTSPVTVPLSFSRDTALTTDAETSSSPAAGVATEKAKKPHPFIADAVFLHVSREQLGVPLNEEPPAAPTSSSSAAPLRPAHVRAAAGMLCYSTRNTLYVWLSSRVIAITLPSVITAVDFFTDHLAVVTMSEYPPPPASAASSITGAAGSRKGILKLVVRPRERLPALGREPHEANPESVDAADVQASFAWLPNGLKGTMVDVVSTAGAKGHTDRPLEPSDLLGAVWVVSSQAQQGMDGASARSDSGSSGGASVVANEAETTSGGSSDVSYMIVEGADPQEGLTFRVYPAPDTARSDGRSNNSFYHVDRNRHQLIASQTYAPRVSTETLASLPASERERAVTNGMTSPSTVVTAVSPQQGTIRSFAPLIAQVSHVAMSNDRGLAYAFSPDTQQISIADANIERVQRRYADWHAMLSGSVASVGEAEGDGDDTARKDFKMEYSTPRKQPSGTLKHGEVDDKEHHGGNTWAGGTGGTDTAGLGGIIGPYRLDKGNTVHQVSPEERRKVPKHLVEEARRMGKEALKERLKAIGMTEAEYESYKTLQDRVRPSIAQLRTLLLGLKAAEGERTWLKGQTDGVWDDRKLVEGIVGEKNVFKRRVDSKESNPFQQKYKKRCLFVLDVSASMYRFEGLDRRLTKLLESTVMIMEAFAGSEEKIEYAMIGHNGDSDCIPLVNFGEPPRNHKERMVVCQKMIAYAQYCWSGDNTVEAMRESIKLVTAAKGDAYFVFVVSDANLRQYGITPGELTEIIRSHREVQMFCIFIATIGQQSSQLQRQLPVGHGYECMKTDMLPQVLRQIFTSVNLL